MVGEPLDAAANPLGEAAPLATPAPQVPGAYTVSILSPRARPSAELLRCLEEEGIAYVVADGGMASAADVLLLDLTEADRPTAEALAKRGGTSGQPTLAALAWEHLQAPALRVDADDVIVCPWRPGELLLRIRRQTERPEPPDVPGVFRARDLVLDTNRYDVYLAGRALLLTFKEYELLKLLIANAGRVFSRETLLAQVWGYQYFGGTRTVDVHIRRLRSKIEDATHTFIDTVWNVGYRFRG